MHKNMNGLLTWLADGQMKLKGKLRRLAKNTKPSAKKLRGHYKPQGTKQAKRTEQHHAKQAKDAYNRAQADGFGDLQMMFMQKSHAVDSGPPNMDDLAKDGIWETERLKRASYEEVEDDEDEEVEVEDGEDQDEEVEAEDDDEISLSDDEHQSSNEEDGDGFHNLDMGIKSNILDTIICEEDGFRDLPDLCMPWQPNSVSQHFHFPPDAKAATKCLCNLEDLISPKRKTGHGHKDPHLNLVLRARLETMATFLRLYKMNGFMDWVGSSELAAQSAGKGPWLARKLHEWTHALIHDETDIP